MVGFAFHAVEGYAAMGVAVYPKAVGAGKGRGPKAGLTLGEESGASCLIFFRYQIIPVGIDLKENLVRGVLIRMSGNHFELSLGNAFVGSRRRWNSLRYAAVFRHFNEGVVVVGAVLLHWEGALHSVAGIYPISIV